MSLDFFPFIFILATCDQPSKEWGKKAMGVLTHGLFIWNEDEERGTEISATGCREKASIDFYHKSWKPEKNNEIGSL